MKFRNLYNTKLTKYNIVRYAFGMDIESTGKIIKKVAKSDLMYCYILAAIEGETYGIEEFKKLVKDII